MTSPENDANTVTATVAPTVDPRIMSAEVLRRRINRHLSNDMRELRAVRPTAHAPSVYYVWDTTGAIPPEGPYQLAQLKAYALAIGALKPADQQRIIVDSKGQKLPDLPVSSLTVEQAAGTAVLQGSNMSEENVGNLTEGLDSGMTLSQGDQHGDPVNEAELAALIDSELEAS